MGVRANTQTEKSKNGMGTKNRRTPYKGRVDTNKKKTYCVLA